MPAAAGDARYPIGRFAAVTPLSADMRAAAIEDIGALPRRVREAVDGLNGAQLDTPYRDGGWTVRQVVHHLADSHMNGYIRVKLALTEENPTIKPYDENAWAPLPDMALPADVSLRLLDALHQRWMALYEGMAPAQFDRTFFHPEMGKSLTLGDHLQLYSWHSRHHVAHITELRRRRGW